MAGGTRFVTGLYGWLGGRFRMYLACVVAEIAECCAIIMIGQYPVMACLTLFELHAQNLVLAVAIRTSD